MTDFVRRQRALLERSPTLPGALSTIGLGANTAWGEISLATDSVHSRMIVLPVADAITVRKDVRSRGLHVMPVAELVADQSTNAAIIKCVGPEYWSVFDDLISSILANAGSYDGDPNALIARWRSALATPPTGVTLEQSIGLWGELRFLVERQTHGDSSLRAWTATAGSQHDFSYPRAQVEIKTSRSTAPRRVRISGLGQLEAIEGRSLFLRAYFIDSDATGTTIPDLVDQLISGGVDREALREALDERGFTEQALTEEQNNRWAVRAQAAWLVDLSFPKITRSSLGTQLSASMVSVTYEIEVESLWSVRMPEMDFHIALT